VKKKMRQSQRAGYEYEYTAVQSCGCILARCSGRKSERRRAARFADRFYRNGIVVRHLPPAEVARKTSGCRCQA
jgi:hypothetical protein